VTDDKRSPERSFLSRWSQRKLAASREAAARSEPAKAVVPVQATEASAVPVATPAPPPPVAIERTVPELPPVESLSFDSDFTPFMKAGVDESIKRQALRKLVTDPRFNVMDGLDVYIDDYTRFEPVTPDVLAQLRHAKYVFDPPKTRVNAQGEVEDVPDEPASPQEAAEEAQPDATVDVAAHSAPAADEPATSLPDRTSDDLDNSTVAVRMPATNS
jgi:hypothetical protein